MKQRELIDRITNAKIKKHIPKENLRAKAKLKLSAITQNCNMVAHFPVKRMSEMKV